MPRTCLVGDTLSQDDEVDGAAFAAVRAEVIQVQELLLSLGATDGEYLYHVVQTLLDGARNPYQSGVALLVSQAIAGEVPAEVVRFAAAVKIIDVAALAHRQTASLGDLAPTEQPAIDAHLVVLAGDYMYAQAAYITAGLRNLEVMAILAEEIKSQCRGEIERQRNKHAAITSAGAYSLSVVGTAHLLGCDAKVLAELRAYGAALDAAKTAALAGGARPLGEQGLLIGVLSGPARDALISMVGGVYRYTLDEMPAASRRQS
jgi:geranylgeranyl pyrophosphate synthase